MALTKRYFQHYNNDRNRKIMGTVLVWPIIWKAKFGYKTYTANARPLIFRL